MFTSFVGGSAKKIISFWERLIEASDEVVHDSFTPRCWPLDSCKSVLATTSNWN